MRIEKNIYLFMDKTKYLNLNKSVSQSLRFGPKSQFLYFEPILLDSFVTIVMVKVK